MYTFISNLQQDVLVCCTSYFLITIMYLIATLEASSEHVCRYGLIGYPIGTFFPDVCKVCQCHADGVVSCRAESCPPAPQNCQEYVTPPDRCCGVCVRDTSGCMHNETLYQRGQRIPSDPCHVCYCPWKQTNATSNGRTTEYNSGRDVTVLNATCVELVCPVVTCPDPITPLGKCCPVCSDGEFYVI